MLHTDILLILKVFN